MTFSLTSRMNSYCWHTYGVERLMHRESAHHTRMLARTRFRIRIQPETQVHRSFPSRSAWTVRYSSVSDEHGDGSRRESFGTTAVGAASVLQGLRGRTSLAGRSQGPPPGGHHRIRSQLADHPFGS